MGVLRSAEGQHDSRPGNADKVTCVHPYRADLISPTHQKLPFDNTMLDRAFVCSQCMARLTGRSIVRTKLHPRFSLPRRLNSHVASNNRPIRVAVMGSGPAGFYATSRLLSRQQDTVVDMYEKLPVPFGLARYGVAPDHPEVKVRICSISGIGKRKDKKNKTKQKLIPSPLNL